MANSRIVVPDAALIVDTYGGVVGIENAGKVTYFSRVLATSGNPVAHTGDTADTTLASILIPGGCMGPRGALRMTLLFSCTDSTNAKTFHARLGGSNDVLGFYQVTAAGTSAVTFQRTVFNSGDEGHQTYLSGWGTYGQTGGSLTSKTIDTSQDQYLNISAQLALGTETVTLDGYTIEVLHG